MTQQSELHTLAVKVGEISGQLRELIHNQNNMSMKFDGMYERLLTAPTQADLEKLNVRLDVLAARLDALEANRDRNDGAKGVFAVVLQSRFAAWVAAAVGGAYIAIDKGVFK